MAKSKAKKKAPARSRAKAKKKKAMSVKRRSSKAVKKKSAVRKRAARPKPKSSKKKKSVKTAKTKRTARTARTKRTARTARRPVPIRAKRSAKSAVEQKPALVPVPLPEGVRPQRSGESNERSAHLDKLKQMFDAAPISRYLGMALGYCENGVSRVRLPFRKDFEEGHGVIHGGLIGLLADTAGNFSVASVSPGSTVKTVEFKLSLLTSVQGDLLAIGEVVRKGRTLATCRLEVVEGNDRVVAIGLATYALQAV